MMDCAEFEVLLADHIDGTLAAGQSAEFAHHMETCRGCAELARDARSAVSLMQISADVETPPELITKILHATDAGWDLRKYRQGFRGWINRTLSPVLKPRFVMSAMVSLLSITMLSRCAGAPKVTLTAHDLDPVQIWSSLDLRSHRLWDRAVKSYESMRLVYEIRSQFSEWQQQQTDDRDAAADADAAEKQIDQPAVGGSKPGPAGAKQENRK
jgi:hypothetical protein